MSRINYVHYTLITTPLVIVCFYSLVSEFYLGIWEKDQVEEEEEEKDSQRHEQRMESVPSFQRLISYIY